MPFITQGKANIKYLLIVVLVAAIAGGIIFSARNSYYKDIINLDNFSEINRPVKNIKDKTTELKTYSNEKFGYSINYLSNWTFREFPDTKTGAGFRPLSSLEEVASECINIDAREIPEKEYYEQYIPFNDYVKKVAISEIQNYEELNSIEKITTENGLVGYKTTWIYRSLVGGQEKISLPITYFENQNAVQTKSGPIKHEIIRISLGGKDCEEAYDQMLSTFQFTGTSTGEAVGLKVISPNGGERFESGKTYTITWDASSDVKNIAITILEGSSQSFLIKEGIAASVKKFDWKINGTEDYVGRDDLTIAIYDAAKCGYVGQDIGAECIKDELIHSDASDNYFSIIK